MYIKQGHIRKPINELLQFLQKEKWTRIWDNERKAILPL